MDLQKMRKIAGIDSKVTGQHIEDVRKQMNEHLDAMARDVQLDRLDEGLFTNIKAILDMGSSASKKAAQEIAKKADAQFKKAQSAFKDAQAKQRLKVFAKEMGKVEASMAKFETDPDLVEVLKAAPLLATLFKGIGAKMQDVNGEVAALLYVATGDEGNSSSGRQEPTM